MDYVPATADIIISAVGSTGNLVADRCLSVDLIDDSVDEVNEVFAVSIINVESGVTIEEPSQSRITVIDNDGE